MAEGGQFRGVEDELEGAAEGDWQQGSCVGR